MKVMDKAIEALFFKRSDSDATVTLTPIVMSTNSYLL